MALILIAEDDPLITRLYQKALSYDGFEVVTASDGQEAIDVAMEKMPTLIMLDVMMPIMNGVEVLEALKTNPKTKAIPVIVLTNLSDMTDVETLLDKGAVKYIVKSEHKPLDIVKMVKEILAGYTRDEIPKL